MRSGLVCRLPHRPRRRTRRERVDGDAHQVGANVRIAFLDGGAQRAIEIARLTRRAGVTETIAGVAIGFVAYLSDGKSDGLD